MKPIKFELFYLTKIATSFQCLYSIEAQERLVALWYWLKFTYKGTNVPLPCHGYWTNKSKTIKENSTVMII